MNNEIFVSTSCTFGFGDTKSVKNVLDEYAKGGIKNIELGAFHQYEDGILEFLKGYKKKHNARFTLHAYFPPEKKPFIVNLASQDNEILERSIAHIKNMIDIAKTIGAELCSFHAGYLVDPVRLGEWDESDKKKARSHEEAYKVFLSSLEDVCRYAKLKDMRVAFEPNVMSKANLNDGKNSTLLMCELHEIKRLYKDLEKKGIKNLGILIDIGHLKVTAKTLKFDSDEFIEGIKDRVLEIHLHENDSISDQHKPLKSDSWALKVLDRKIFKGAILTLETIGLDINGIKGQIKLLKKCKKGVSQ